MRKRGAHRSSRVCSLHHLLDCLARRAVETRPCTRRAADSFLLVCAMRRCTGSSSPTSIGHRYGHLHGGGASTCCSCPCAARLTGAACSALARTYSPALCSAAPSRDARTRARHARFRGVLRRVYDCFMLLSASSAAVQAGEHRSCAEAARVVLGQVDGARHDGQGLEGWRVCLWCVKCERTGLLRTSTLAVERPRNVVFARM